MLQFYKGLMGYTTPVLVVVDKVTMKKGPKLSHPHISRKIYVTM